MVTRFTFTMSERDGAFVARCDDLSLESTGRTSATALSALRSAIAEKLTSVEAVAPPPEPPSAPQIELVAADPPRRLTHGL